MGQESLLIHCADALMERGYTVVTVISATPRILRWAADRSVRVIDPNTDLYSELSSEAFDYFFSITNLSIVPEAVLRLAQRNAINFHDGPLPAYAGLNVPSWALMRQESQHAVSWHEMRGGVDAGAILEEQAFSIAPRETAFTLNTKCYAAGIESFSRLLDNIEGKAVRRRQQDSTLRGYFGRYKRVPTSGFLDFERPAAELDALVRALDFGPQENPICTAKIAVRVSPRLDSQDVWPGGGGGVLVVTETAAHPESADSAATPGTILDSGPTLRIATSAGDLEILAIRLADGSEARITDVTARYGLERGAVLPRIAEEARRQLEAADERLCRGEAFWRGKLVHRNPAAFSCAEHNRTGERTLGRQTFPLPAGARSSPKPSALCISWIVGFIARATNSTEIEIGYRDEGFKRAVGGASICYATHVPLQFRLDSRTTAAELESRVGEAIDAIRRFGPYSLDLPWRQRVSGPPVPHRIVAAVGDEGAESFPESCDIAFVIAADCGEVTWVYDRRAVSEESVASLMDQFAAYLGVVSNVAESSILRVPLLSPADRNRLLVNWNDTARAFDHTLCVHQAISQQAARTPDAIALVFEGTEVTYRELDRRTNQLANYLQELGVGPDVCVGVSMERGTEMIIAVIGVQKAGGAYVPLDPSYPADRIVFMLDDVEAPVLLTETSVASRLPAHETRTVLLDAEWAAIEQHPDSAPVGDVSPSNLAYVIYTSGSTGRPKGVMVEHRNVLNFFAGMDECVPHDVPGVWLAVTSLSFDISVLELFWTLSRGFKVVLHRDRNKEVSAAEIRRTATRRPIEFSLFYFASDEGETVADKYRLLIEGARFADQNGFVALWTPERHFHAFGGLYPNPSVASAALAMITEKVHLRAGSCVLPLHAPTRVVEEWSLVDNLSNGRVGIAFASGWQPNDFVIAPEKFADRKAIMLRDIETVRKLWRGDTVTMRSPLGKDVAVRTMPRPVQKELPVWITAAGNPETFEEAGRLGANVLTHLLGQSFDEVARKNAIYRKAWADAGHAGRGTITLMLHTFVGHDDEEVKATVRRPMKGYLRSAVNLVKDAAWSFPTFKQRADETGKTPADVFEKEEISEQDMDALLDHAFERYYRTAGLFGTPARCAEIVDKLRDIDVDEVGCLLDYGVPSATIMEHMPLLAEVRRLANATNDASSDAGDVSIGALIERHRVTHFQCTPSMLGMILSNANARQQLQSLRSVLVGGEALPIALATDLRKATGARILNMYGPTETTVWSSSDSVDPSEGMVTIGRPIANTQIYVLDSELEPAPPGIPGEIYIGGAGVTRGYLRRPDLTEERFVRDPFSSAPGARLYRTGDLGRFGRDGRILFLGRVDQQVKIRGYRIELGEIEAAILALPAVRDAAVIAREDSSGDKRLVGYFTVKAGHAASTVDLRSALRGRLPEYMVPSNLVVLDSLPLTPNKKIDRKALPAPESVSAEPKASFLAPATELEHAIAGIWSDLLRMPRVGLDDNFFDSGGHSLLAVQAHRRLRDAIGRDLALTDLFRFPTIRSLVRHLERGEGEDPGLARSVSRAQGRRESLNRRQAMRATRGPTRAPQ
jgi:natural product biosynthesis luciferase-like monooxygenase protein